MHSLGSNKIMAENLKTQRARPINWQVPSPHHWISKATIRVVVFHC